MPEGNDFYDFWTVILAAVALLVSAIAAYTARNANKLARQAQAAEETRFQKSGYEGFHAKVSSIKGVAPPPDIPVGPDVVDLINKLVYIANMWNNEIVDRSVIRSDAWEVYRKYYEMFRDDTRVIPGFEAEARTIKSTVTPLMTQAYNEMQNYIPPNQ